MRFAALQGGGASDYAAAGKKAANEAVSIFATQRKSAPDYGEIAKTGMETRSAEKIAGMQAGAQVAKAGIQAFSQANKVAIGERAKEKIRGIQSKSKKAGGIAALGGIAAAGFMAFSGDEEKAPPTNTDEKRKLINDYIANRKKLTADREANRTDYQPIEQLEGVDSSSTNTSGGSSSTNPSSSSSSTATGGSGSPASPKGGTAGKTTNPSDTGSRYMSFLTGKGLSRVQAAALTGHMDVESDGFRAFEEYSPNAYGTRGAGHLQWTDTSNKGGRRTNFMNFANNQGLDPKSFEANSQFLISEMQGNHGNHWTNGGSYEGFLRTNSLEEASSYLQNNYIRPGVPHTGRRISAAQRYFTNFSPS